MIRTLAAEGVPKARIAARLGISRTTVVTAVASDAAIASIAQVTHAVQDCPAMFWTWVSLVRTLPSMSQLHYANQNLELAQDESADDVRKRIEAKVRERGGWVDVKTVDGEVALLVSTGVPIFIVERRR